MRRPPQAEPNNPEEGCGQPALELFEHAPVGLWEVDSAGLIVAINQTLLRWLGYERAEVLGRLGVEALVRAEDIAVVQSLSERCRREGQVEGVTLVWCTTDGRELPGDVMASAVYDAQGSFLGWRGCVRDALPVQRRWQQQLQEHTLGAVERLASGVAHKFNNLLQVIQGYTELGLITLESAHPVHGYLARVKDAAQRAAALVQGLVAFSRRQVGRRRVLELDAFVSQLSGRLRRAVPAGVELRMALGAAGACVLADAASLEQVVWHLVVNAWEAMPHGGTVVVETRRVGGANASGQRLPIPGEAICLSVRDTGVGIEAELLGQIFEPFFTTKEAGSGLGLAVVWGVVKQHGGHVEVHSRRGEGTTVQVYLPVEACQAS
jgi:PAS domain S-box-containing protein